MLIFEAGISELAEQRIVLQGNTLYDLLISKALTLQTS